MLQDVFLEAYLSPSEIERRLAFALDVFKSRKKNCSYTTLLNQKKKWEAETEDEPATDALRRWQRKLREEGDSKPLYARAGILFAQVLWVQGIVPNPLLEEAAETSGSDLNDVRWEVLNTALYATAMACEARVHADAHFALRRRRKYDPEVFGNARFVARRNLESIFNVTGGESELPAALVTFLETQEKIPKVSQAAENEIVVDRPSIEAAMKDACKLARQLGEREWREFYSGMIEADEET